jgi:hypothetical protein
MMYYGGFGNFGGCGSMWRPYFASAGWDPYSNGAWAWYQGAGYSWVSPYPWGWTPYHFGSWSYCSGAGWGWRPGGSWNGLNNAVVSNGGPQRIPPRPILPPSRGAPTVTVLNMKPLVRSGAVSEDSFVFRRDSAGLGVPRDGLGKLNKLSQSAVNGGAATTPIYFSASSTAPGHGRPASEGVTSISLHRGSAPDTAAGRSWEPRSSGNGGGSAARSGPQAGGQTARSAPQPMSQPSRSAPPPSSQSAPASSSSPGRPR